MRILLSDCPEGHRQVSVELDAEELDLVDYLETQGPAQVDLDIERRGDQLTFRGDARVTVRAECARCAKPVERDLVGEILAFADRRGKAQPQDEAALEQEGSILYHDGLELSLTEPIREAILLEEPVQVLCQEACKGLCPKCGEDLNEGSCNCSTETMDPRWAALKELDSSDS